MQGQKRFSPQLFYSLSPEGLVPGDHFLRRFESLIALDFLYEETRAYYSHTGQPSKQSRRNGSARTPESSSSRQSLRRRALSLPRNFNTPHTAPAHR